MLIPVSLSRLSFRLIDEGIRKGNRNGRRTLIYGAGAGGQIAAKEIENNGELGLVLVGFMDDNPGVQRRNIRGYPVLGGLKDLEKIIVKNNIEEIIVSFKENGTEMKKEIRRLCLGMDVEVDVRQIRVVVD
jgi:UDP-GlcNAc:undecaprenyl-phosphate GlcNAc-1-phosphate transferase